MPCTNATAQKQRERIAALLAENRQLKVQVEAQTRALLVAEAKQEAMESENKRLSKNISLSQKVIMEEINEGKRYRRQIRNERRLRKAATEGNLSTSTFSPSAMQSDARPTFLSAKQR